MATPWFWSGVSEFGEVQIASVAFAGAGGEQEAGAAVRAPAAAGPDAARTGAA
ncbi:hypothetical protein LP420_37550 [Massilia sp. B-10]|nr:hypothetical protein LP420_37550 [Massilia sp. B-10]